MNSIARRSERQDEIVRVLRESGSSSVEDLANSLGTSQVTLRRDLRVLAEAGLLERRVGRVALVSNGANELPFFLRTKENREEKQRIAQAALGLIKNGETIMISGGTTTLELARLLPGQRRLTVITNALQVADLLADKAGIDLVVLGGILRPWERTLHGHVTEVAVRELRAEKFFYGIHAINIQHGLTHNHLQEVSTDRSLIQASVQTIVLVDHTKFGKVASAIVVPVDQVHIVISGRQLAPEFAEGLAAQNVRVILA
ncbi:MAG TPA: DeoR/GlpR family DNA-binding transcription regulator [Anaerolineaceae bacterium]|nr:DeoR/GlpR family DNA-binding transcription regulator [Anaerolineaceae bacterium]